MNLTELKAQNPELFAKLNDFMGGDLSQFSKMTNASFSLTTSTPELEKAYDELRETKNWARITTANESDGEVGYVEAYDRKNKREVSGWLRNEYVIEGQMVQYFVRPQGLKYPIYKPGSSETFQGGLMLECITPGGFAKLSRTSVPIDKWEKSNLGAIEEAESLIRQHKALADADATFEALDAIESGEWVRTGTKKEEILRAMGYERATVVNQEMANA